MAANYSKRTWRKVASDLLIAYLSAVDHPGDVGVLCEDQDARDAVRSLKSES